MPEPWPLIRSQAGPSYRIFSLRVDTAQAPHSGTAHEFCVVDAPDWVNIIALTGDRQVVMVKQFRHGTKEVTLEIPGGMVDEGDSPEQAALRELMEETGYRARSVTLLGVVHPNPAFLTNCCYTYLATDLEKVEGGEHFDDTEDIEVELHPLPHVPALIRAGEVTNSLVVAAFWWYFMESTDSPEEA
jgi:ADP-ribose pyrophosphatase